MAIYERTDTLYDLNDVGSSVRTPAAGETLRFSELTGKWEAEEGEGASVDFILIYDEDSSDPSVSYIGKALPGTLSSAASWQIQRVSIVGDETFTHFADGNANFDNVWDNRKILSYS